MSKRVLAVAPLALALALPPSTVAQEAQAPTMFYIVQDQVKPPMIAEYETASKAFIKDLAATAGIEGIQWTAVSGMEVGYIFVVPVKDFADLGKAFQKWEGAGEKMGMAKWQEHMARSQAMVDHTATSILALRNDLSYMPETAAFTTERPYRHYAWWYVIPGKEQAIEAVAKEFVDLYKTRNIQTGWRIYQHVVGPDLPMYLVVETAENAAAFEARTAKIRETLGEAGMRLEQKAMKLARRVEINDAWIRPDLSFPQETQYGQRP